MAKLPLRSRSRSRPCFCFCFCAVVVFFFAAAAAARSSLFASSAPASMYLEALRGSLLFFEGQRSGRLPPSQRASWRSDSALHDGFAQGVDLVGGYYDAGDNVKFGLPMAFTITMLSWSVVEYGHHIRSAGELQHAMEAIRWGTDYLLKAHPQPNVLWGEVGDGDSDHYCWQRPEEMTTSRRAYRIDENNPGSDLAGETAAAMAAASIALRRFDPEYANLLVSHSKQLFAFADNHRGRYDSSISIARSYYESESGYNDELLWASLWLYEATSEKDYLYYAVENAHSLGGASWTMTEFSWDVKYAGVQVLASKILFKQRGHFPDVEALQIYRPQADFFMCACLQKNYGKNVARTPGGLIYTRSWNNMQYVSSATFLMSVYSDYLTASRQGLHCAAGSVEPSELLKMAKSQVDYILGDNPRGTSYIVGVGNNYPQRIHHRAASIVSYKIDKTFVECREGYRAWYTARASDPNIHVGALVGGPDENDNYADDRENFEQSEPATYNNGPLVGVLARMYGGSMRTRAVVDGYDNSLFSARSSETGMAEHASASYISKLYIAQEETNSWNDKGKEFYRYKAELKNGTPHTLLRLQLLVKNLEGPLWGLAKEGDDDEEEEEAGVYYTFPPWIDALPSGKTLGFVYIHSSPAPANITVTAAALI